MAPRIRRFGAISISSSVPRFGSRLLLVWMLLCAVHLVAEPLTVCSFNVKWVGYSEQRDDEALASLVAAFDIVLVQEIVSPPYDGAFPDGSPFRPDPQSAEFFDAMASQGFEWELSPEDTGTGDRNRINSSATEWWAAFYRPERVALASDLPGGFLAVDVTDHPSYERVPFAFPFRSRSSTMDFVLISVHLKPGGTTADAARRREELAAVRSWIDAQYVGSAERDFFIVGDMNFADCDEIASALPAGMDHLNRDCRATNTVPGTPRPYDNVLYSPQFSTEVDVVYGFEVVDLVTEMRRWWNPAHGDYPGSPYDHREFSRRYSDHNPVAFRLDAVLDDD